MRLWAVYLIAAVCAIAAGPTDRRGHDPAMEPVRLITEPGPEYGTDQRPFQGIPGLERTKKGRLWATWYSGGPGEGSYNYVLLISSDDDGVTWTPPRLIVDPPTPVRGYDATLWLDPKGSLWLFWAQSYTKWDGRGGVWATVSRNPDAKKPKWSEPRRIAHGVMMNKPTALRNGEWLLPIAGWARPAEVVRQIASSRLDLPADEVERATFSIPEEHGSAVWSSTDQGRTWTRKGRATPPNTDFDEHMVVERKDGSLWMLARTKSGIGQCESRDGGRTWGEWQETGIPHPVTRFFVRRLRSGKLLMVRHHEMAGKTRSHLAAYLSDDDGKTWSGGLILDKRTSVSYPDGVEAPDGRIYIIHDRERTRAREILMSVFREKDIEAGSFVSPGSRQKVLINKAGK